MIGVMGIPDIEFFGVGVLVFVIVVFRASMKLRVVCPVCASRMSLVSVFDSRGAEVERRISVFLDLGARSYCQSWVCGRCGEKKLVRVSG